MMMLIQFLTVAAALLLPTSFVIAAPGTPYNPRALAHGVSPLATQTSAPHHASNPAEFTKRDDSPTKPAILDAEPISVVTAQTADILFEHGWCSFKMQLIDQCVHNPQENWHEEMIGMLTSIQDNSHKTVVEYPGGAGRIDRGAVRLSGLGDFRLAWNKGDKQVYFSFNNGWWASNTKHETSEFGFCNWTPWSRGDLVCSPEHGTQYRVSNMGCVFKCQWAE